MPNRRKFTGLVDALGRKTSQYSPEKPGFRVSHRRRSRTEACSECEHKSCKVEFDEEAARSMTEYEIKRRWPRFEGECPDCGGRVIKYASASHYIQGDW